MTEKPEFIYDTHGDWQATRIGPYIFDGRGEWIGFTEFRSVYTRDGEWVGELAKDGRILRKRAGAKRPLNSNVPPKPTLKKSELPGRAPLPQQCQTQPKPKKHPFRPLGRPRTSCGSLWRVVGRQTR